MKIKKGDNVIMLSGKDRGKTGTVLHARPADARVVVGGLNLVKRHLRRKSATQKGQIVSVERWVHASTVAPVNKNTGKAARVGWQVAVGGESKVRIDKKTKTTL
jgi:large subunit ribosomal protein L24